MWAKIKFHFVGYLFHYFITNFNIQCVFATLDASKKESNELIRVTNVFTGCTIRVMNFQGKQIDFRRINEPIILVRYRSFCKTLGLFPFELGSTYSDLSEISSCNDVYRANLDFPTDQVAISYVAQTYTESFQMKNNKKVCEADVYFYPPSEHKSPQMFVKNFYWDSFLLHPLAVHLEYTWRAIEWKEFFKNTVPKISLLICDSAGDSICGNQEEIRKWIAGALFELRFDPRLSIHVLIWESSSRSLKTLCPYCDPCDSFKTIRLSSKFFPTSRNELEKILLESQKMNPDPHTIRVVLIAYANHQEGLKKKDRRNQKAVLEHIRAFTFYFGLSDSDLHFSADIHLTSLLLPEHANITFSNRLEKDERGWQDVIVDACSKTKPIRSHFLFRPAVLRRLGRIRNLFDENQIMTHTAELLFVSCHKEQMHWISQLRELISPFDIPTWVLILAIVSVASWLVKLSMQLHTKDKIRNYFDIIFLMFTPFLDQSSNLFSSASKDIKNSLLICVYFVPISLLYLSTLYKGDNVTRLTAQPPLTQFDTFAMLEKNQFTTYSRRENLKTSLNAKYYNTGVLAELYAQYGRVFNHETIPVVSELWTELMNVLGPIKWTNRKSLNYFKHEISKQMWKYINNSAMLPDHGKSTPETLDTILDIHMNKCNKSAIILPVVEAITLHKIQKQLRKPSFLGKDKILQTFWGYRFERYFPSHLVFRARYLFEAGLFEWWKNYFDFTFNLKLDVRAKSWYSAKYQNDMSSMSFDKTAVAVLTLIPGVGLLSAIFVFIFWENILNGGQRRNLKTILTNSISSAVKLYVLAGELIFKVRNNLLKTYVFRISE